MLIVQSLVYARFVSTNVGASAVDVCLANDCLYCICQCKGIGVVCIFLLFMLWHCIVYALPMQGLQSSLHCFVYAVARSKEKKFSSLVHAFVYAWHAAKFSSLYRV